MKDGIIIINKPQGLTSNDVIYRMKSILGIRKIGHTGTLDPLAEGVLPILINKGTRIAEYLDVDFKTYRCTMVLGIKTDTYDVTGEVLEDKLVSVTEVDILKAFSTFHGLIEQYPPMYSAVRIEGRKLYEIMYDGTESEKKEIEKKISPRQVYIENITVEDPIYVEGDSKYSRKPHCSFTVTCSKGTYIRTICNDVGEILGCGAAMESLVRTKSGAFTIEDSVTLEELTKIAEENDLVREEVSAKGIRRLVHNGEMDKDIPSCLENFVKPLDYPLDVFGIAYVNNENANRFIDGWHLSLKEVEIKREPMYFEPVSVDCLRDSKENSKNNHHGSYPGLKVHPKYKAVYRIYRDDNTFLGVAFLSDKYHKLVADKVLYRFREND